jgi:ParB-like chromosome segregation protein Spo0J
VAEATGEAAGAEDSPDESQREGSSEDEDEDGDEVTYELRPPAQGMVTSISVEQVDEDATFRIRPEGEITQLATDLARLGQLFPVDVRPLGADRYQIICGFRRVAALRFLKRDQVQARVHEGLSDDDALMMALASAIHASPVDREELEAKRDQLDEQGRLSAAARDMLEKALATEDGLAPETMEEEVDADELAGDVSQRLGEINQDLSLLADVFKSLDESRRAELLMQLRYSAELVAYLEGL